MVGYLLILGMGATGDIDVVPVTDSESKWFDETHGMECKMCEIRLTREERICQGWIEVLQFFSGERGSSLSGSSGDSERASGVFRDGNLVDFGNLAPRSASRHLPRRPKHGSG